MSPIEDTRVYESRYQQIAVEMAEKIAEGWYEVGDRITSRSTIATTFHVSPETARKAMQVLVDMGIVTVKHGSGTYVASREKAQLYFEKFHDAVSIAQTREQIVDAIATQRRDAVKRGDETNISPGPYERVQVGDVILFVGNDLSRQKMLNLFNSPTPDPASLTD